MRARIKFAKFDTQRFIGHLDVMRYFQRLFNRSGLPMRYSEGFHPHQILSFAQPLGLGVTSDGEYLDMELTEEMSCEDIISTLNANISPGFEIMDCVRLADREANKKLVTSMSLISRSIYLLILKDGYEINDLKESLKTFINRSDITVIKKTKKGEKEIDLKAFIYEIYDYSNNFEVIYIKENVNKTVYEENLCNQIKHAPEYENGKKIIVSLSAGSETNINPDLFLSTFLEYISAGFGTEAFRIHRMDLLGGPEEESVPLCRIL